MAGGVLFCFMSAVGTGWCSGGTTDTVIDLKTARRPNRRHTACPLQMPKGRTTEMPIFFGNCGLAGSVTRVERLGHDPQPTTGHARDRNHFNQLRDRNHFSTQLPMSITCSSKPLLLQGPSHHPHGHDEMVLQKVLHRTEILVREHNAGRRRAVRKIIWHVRVRHV